MFGHLQRRHHLFLPIEFQPHIRLCGVPLHFPVDAASFLFEAQPDFLKILG
jgi:hypothetical protein